MPTEIHEHFDNDDQRTGYTIVTRESPWDDDSRGRALRLAEYENSMCGCGCNLPAAISYDESKVWAVDTITCQAGRALAQVTRMESEAAEKQNRPAGWSDGKHYYVVPQDSPPDE